MDFHISYTSIEPTPGDPTKTTACVRGTIDGNGYDFSHSDDQGAILEWVKNAWACLARGEYPPHTRPLDGCPLRATKSVLKNSRTPSGVSTKDTP